MSIQDDDNGDDKSSARKVFAPDIDPMLSGLVLMVKDGRFDPADIWLLFSGGAVLQGKLVPSDLEVTARFFGMNPPEPKEEPAQENLEEWQLLQKQSYCFLSDAQLIGGSSGDSYFALIRVKLASVVGWGLGGRRNAE